MKKTIELIIIILLIGSPTLLISQENSKSDSPLECVEKRYFGTSDLLVNGRKYIPYNTRANGHPFYKTDELQEGTIYVRDLVFDPVKIKYNVERDQLILLHELSNSTIVNVIVSSTLIDSFKIGNALFIHRKHIQNLNEGPNFFKQIYSGKTRFFMLSQKHFLPIFNEVNPYGRYSDSELTYFLDTRNHNVVRIKNKRDFLKYYSEHKSLVKRFLKKESIRFRKARDEEFVKLMKFCDEL